MTTVIEIVKAHLKANGFDGLCHLDTECGCHLEDFHICRESFADCEPAYKIDLPPGDGRGTWWMTVKKPAASTTEIEARALEEAADRLEVLEREVLAEDDDDE